MAGDFFPRREADLVLWSSSLCRNILLAPEAFAMPVGQAEDLALAAERFAQAHRRASDPDTATTPAVRVKNDAKRELIRQLRFANMRVRSGAVTPEMLASLGLGAGRRGGRKTLLPRLEDAPLLVIEKAEDSRVYVRIRSKSGGNPNARPRGAVGALVYRAIGPEPAGGRFEWKFVKQVAGRRVEVDFSDDDVAPGTPVWITARWVTRRGLTSPGATAVTVNLPGGSSFPRLKRSIAA